LLVGSFVRPTGRWRKRLRILTTRSNDSTEWKGGQADRTHPQNFSSREVKFHRDHKALFWQF
jgi:coproporphyrinogen III oxidase